jgi:hypothetical protein
MTTSAVTSAAIYLVHMNPMTNAHKSIISTLLKRDYRVYVFPVRFIKDGEEVNTKSFPFSYELRKQMVESVFGSFVTVLPDYTFYAPYIKYMPPFFSPRSWKLRNQILAHIKEETFVSYTGDNAERFMLKAYKLNPLKANRLEVSASLVKEKLYQQVTEGGTDEEWRERVPEVVAEIIKSNWSIVCKFARIEDRTVRIMGMKFPKEGYK